MTRPSNVIAQRRLATQHLLTPTLTDPAEVVRAARSTPRRSPTAHLLPNYDEYFIGFKDRSAIGERLSLAEGAMVGDALRAHVIVVDGQLVGGWKRTLTKTAAVVEVTLLVGLSRPEREAVVGAVRALGDFLELRVEVRGL
ncbi:MAG TPA: crosslink repair DNA glycosylase YcaQ family protein [Gemmatimonadales bacterium]